MWCTAGVGGGLFVVWWWHGSRSRCIPQININKCPPISTPLLPTEGRKGSDEARTHPLSPVSGLDAFVIFSGATSELSTFSATPSLHAGPFFVYPVWGRRSRSRSRSPVPKILYSQFSLRLNLRCGRGETENRPICHLSCAPKGRSHLFWLN